MTEEVRTTSSTGGQKGVKAERLDLLPRHPLEVVARHYAKGAEKYDDHNWRKGYEWSKSFASLQRHALAFWDGENIDEETGSPHLAGVVFHAFALLQFMKDFPDFDDRYKPVVEDEDISGPYWDGVNDALRNMTPEGELPEDRPSVTFTPAAPLPEEWQDLGYIESTDLRPMQDAINKLAARMAVPEQTWGAIETGVPRISIDLETGQPIEEERPLPDYSEQIRQSVEAATKAQQVRRFYQRDYLEPPYPLLFDLPHPFVDDFLRPDVDEPAETE